MASNSPRCARESAIASAIAVKDSRSRAMAAGERIRAWTLRVRSCSGGSVSSTSEGGRAGFSRAKSWSPTPRAEEKVRQSSRIAFTSA